MPPPMGYPASPYAQRPTFAPSPYANPNMPPPRASPYASPYMAGGPPPRASPYASPGPHPGMYQRPPNMSPYNASPYQR